MSSQIFTPNTQAAILARMIEEDPAELTPDVARYLLSIKLPPTDEERVNELSAKARLDSLTEGERHELEGYLHITILLGVVQSKARQLLSAPPNTHR